MNSKSFWRRLFSKVEANGGRPNATGLLAQAGVDFAPYDDQGRTIERSDPRAKGVSKFKLNSEMDETERNEAVAVAYACSGLLYAALQQIRVPASQARAYLVEIKPDGKEERSTTQPKVTEFLEQVNHEAGFADLVDAYITDMLMFGDFRARWFADAAYLYPMNAEQLQPMYADKASIRTAMAGATDARQRAALATMTEKTIIKFQQQLIDGTAETVELEDVLRDRIRGSGGIHTSPAQLAYAYLMTEPELLRVIRGNLTRGGLPAGILAHDFDTTRGTKPLSEPQKKAIEESFFENFGRDGRKEFGVYFADGQINYTKLGLDLDALINKDLFFLIQTTVHEIFGTNARRSWAGQESSSQRASARTDEAWVWMNTTEPWLDRFLMKLSPFVLGKLNVDKRRYALRWDFSGVAAAQEIENMRRADARLNFQIGLVTRAYTQEQMGLPVDETELGQQYSSKEVGALNSNPEQITRDNKRAAVPKKVTITTEDIDDAAAWVRGFDTFAADLIDAEGDDE